MDRPVDGTSFALAVRQPGHKAASSPRTRAIAGYRLVQQRYRIALLVVSSVFWLAAAPAWADGTVSFRAHILPMIKTKPELEKFLFETFKISDDGLGTRISDQAMPHLGGARTGPYAFQVTWQGTEGDTPVTLIIDTDIKFFDRAGREIKNGRLKQAVSFQESFSSLDIEPPR